MKEIPTTDFVEIRLPNGVNKRAVRDNFARIGGSSAKQIYDSDHDRGHPTSEAIQAALESIPQGHVMIMLASNAYTVENELHAFIITSVEGWKELTGPLFMFPKLIRIVHWSAVSMSVI